MTSPFCDPKSLTNIIHTLSFPHFPRFRIGRCSFSKLTAQGWSGRNATFLELGTHDFAKCGPTQITKMPLQCHCIIHYMRRDEGWAACLPPYFPYIKCPPPKLLFNIFEPIGGCGAMQHQKVETGSQRHRIGPIAHSATAHIATAHSATDLVECSQRQHNRINNRIHAHSATAHSATGHSATHLAGVLTAPQLIVPQLTAPHICCGAVSCGAMSCGAMRPHR
ncbi:hypothetical protein J6590_075028 [Homalodisca vitripennis]|nr:hypothetical protein J6590_075028 [Homalodisca vitripennis]